MFVDVLIYYNKFKSAAKVLLFFEICKFWGKKNEYLCIFFAALGLTRSLCTRYNVRKL